MKSYKDFDFLLPSLLALQDLFAEFGNRGMLPFEIEAIERRKVHKIGELEFYLPTPEDLIIFKAVAHRPKDMLDIQAIIENNPNIDKERIKYWVKEFLKVLEIQEIWDDIEKLLKGGKV